MIDCPFDPYGVFRPTKPGYCYATITVPLPVTSDNCGVASAINDFNNTSNASGNYPAGMTIITWTVTDVNGNTSTCQDYIYVFDTQKPTVLTQNITVYLNSNGFVSITPSQINNGSHDNCGIQSLVLSQTLFTCANVGPNTVILTVTDMNGNQNTGSATVTVIDIRLRCKLSYLTWH